MTRIPFLSLLTVLTINLSQLASANIALWIGDPGNTATTNWSDNANWNNIGAGGVGPNGNDILFGDMGASGSAGIITSVLNSSGLNPLSLSFTNGAWGPSRYQTILIPSGIAMTNANSLTVGINSIDANYPTTGSFVGGGTLMQNGNLTVRNASSTGNSGRLATLDLSGLSNFVLKASAGTLSVGGSGSEARGSGLLNLAGGSNNITVGTMSIGTATGNVGLSGTLNLGLGTNIINVANLNLGAGKANNAIIQFLGETGGLRIRGVGGTDNDRATFLIGNRNFSATTNGNVAGTMDLTGTHPVDIKAATITLGQATTANPPSTYGNSGLLEFDNGIVNANAVNLAINSLSGVSTSGEIDVGSNATLVVNGGFSMANQTAGVSTGNLNIWGGTVQIFGNVTKANTQGNATITMVGGVLNMAGLTNTIGTTAIPIDSLILNYSTLTLPVLGNKPSVSLTYLLNNNPGNTINITAVPNTNSFPAEFPIIAYSQSVGTPDFQLGTLAGGYSGYITNDIDQSFIGLVLTSAPAPTPVITNLVVSGINLQFMGINGSAGQPFYLLASTNAALPPSNWLNVATYNFDANGNFNFTIPARTNRWSFFRLQVQ
jgi:hypothetical protein